MFNYQKTAEFMSKSDLEKLEKRVAESEKAAQDAADDTKLMRAAVTFLRGGSISAVLIADQDTWQATCIRSDVRCVCTDTDLARAVVAAAAAGELAGDVLAKGMLAKGLEAITSDAYDS